MTICIPPRESMPVGGSNRTKYPARLHHQTFLLPLTTPTRLPKGRKERTFRPSLQFCRPLFSLQFPGSKEIFYQIFFFAKNFPPSFLKEISFEEFFLSFFSRGECQQVGTIDLSPTALNRQIYRQIYRQFGFFFSPLYQLTL